MSDIGKMYAISSGDYSDYKVLAVFGNKETAEAWVAAMLGRTPDEDEFVSSYQPRIETLDFVPAGMAPVRLASYSYSVTLWDSGEIEYGRVIKDEGWAIDLLYGAPPSRPHLRFVRAPMHGGKGGRLDIRADSDEACRKVANDRVAAWRAGSWLTKDLREWTNEKETE